MHANRSVDLVWVGHRENNFKYILTDTYTTPKSECTVHGHQHTESFDSVAQHEDYIMAFSKAYFHQSENSDVNVGTNSQNPNKNLISFQRSNGVVHLQLAHACVAWLRWMNYRICCEPSTLYMTASLDSQQRKPNVVSNWSLVDCWGMFHYMRCNVWL